METIKVNMNPNPLDVQTIHASQNDTEARQWEFELHNNGELIDTSDVKEQLVFKAYKGGTEQILPENTSTPTTSPFKGDIRYPQGLLTDQEFIYRQSPTESDGLAKITDIKGNTLVWNQLVKNGNFESTNNWTTFNGTVNKTVSNNVMTMAVSSSIFSVAQYAVMLRTGHKIFFHMEARASENDKVVTNWRGKPVGTDWTVEEYIGTENNTACLMGLHNKTGADTTGVTAYLRNCMVIDLTAVFGAGNEPTTVSDFTSLFSLPYYSYNQGTLLSFMGNGIKTVGKNLFHNTATSTTNQGITWTVNEDGSVTANGTCVNNVSVFKMYTPLLRKGTYIANGTPSDSAWGGANPTWRIRLGHQDGSYINDVYSEGRAFTLTEAEILEVQCNIAVGKTVSNQMWFPMITFQGADSTFEPYTSHTTNLPISTYFPTGMKSAGSVYDELTETKAITRVGAYTITSFQGKSGATANNLFSTNAIVNLVKKPSADTVLANIKSNYGEAKTMSVLYNNDTVGVAINTNGTIYVGFGRNGSVTTLEQANSYVQSNPITVYYELKTPTETSFTTASLVTENAEIPLSNEDGTLIGKCTKELSAEPGFHDAKIKLSDADGECYSNKLQLHVERSPQ